jgi:plasmid stabilization system protein ParE
VSLPVFITPQAEEHIRTIDGWWREHRLAAPALFTEELAACFELMADAPHIGRPYRSSSVAGVRRLLLRATHYHVYYVTGEKAVIVLAVWHARRGTGPKLTT